MDYRRGCLNRSRLHHRLLPLAGLLFMASRTGTRGASTDRIEIGKRQTMTPIAFCWISSAGTRRWRFYHHIAN
ncbi:hypothetical protein RvVAR0630_18950 [Agrobacterium vitis]|nr:hypothetical protein RvVAR0630_18950 [Agrobacterium vitis]